MEQQIIQAKEDYLIPITTDQCRKNFIAFTISWNTGMKYFKYKLNTGV
jgi:hypothetical protein